ncbi:hypothetical protein HHK36_032692 [Tetracentron sinense]|uniref:DNA-3-methyladenine glycosylase I n=1 Tax=Tetracentron sinense TaxID=13715 RepID=A0A834Y4K9_TETSI|nr:hypothetical protein HHK36_032692 [Tetracentron sinense]
MCSSKAKVCHGADITPTIAHIDGRPVLQPTCNRVPSLERRHSIKKISQKCPPPPPPPPVSPKSKSPRPAAIKRGNDPNGLNSSVDKALTPRCTTKTSTLVRKKSKKISSAVVDGATAPSIDSAPLDCSSLIVEAPGSIAAARREQMTLIQAQRKMRIAHYGRTKSGKFEEKVVPIDSSNTTALTTGREEKRCSFITPNSVLSGAQVGSDWTSILKKRQDFRDAFSEFDAEIVASFNERQITSICADYGIDLSRVRGVVDNSNRILQIRREFGSFNKYLWGFINHKPISTQYRSCHKIPVKTSKSETISKDMVRRGFRFVGPTVMHSFMQAAGLTNDHLIACPRHLQCTALASQKSTIAPDL